MLSTAVTSFSVNFLSTSQVEKKKLPFLVQQTSKSFENFYQVSHDNSWLNPLWLFLKKSWVCLFFNDALKMFFRFSCPEKASPVTHLRKWNNIAKTLKDLKNVHLQGK